MSDEQKEGVRRVLRTGKINPRILLRLLHEVLLVNVRPARASFGAREGAENAAGGGDEENENNMEANYSYAFCSLQCPSQAAAIHLLCIHFKQCLPSKHNICSFLKPENPAARMSLFSHPLFFCRSCSLNNK